jgi:hypothetical protein
MNNLGRLVMVCCWVALAGCGPQETPEMNTPEEAPSQPSEVTQQGGPKPPLCPEVMPPPCEDGVLYPIYGTNGCLTGFECRAQ